MHSIAHGGARKAQGKMDTPDTHACTQNLAINSNATPEHASVTSVKPHLPASDTKPRTDEPGWLGSQLDTSDACTCTQNIANDSRRPADTPERVRASK